MKHIKNLIHLIDRLLADIIVLLVHIYQLLLSPLLKIVFGPGSGCRFHPTCSQYARECFLQHPFFIALYLSIRRILKCHPYHAGGYDPVPPQNR